MLTGEEVQQTTAQQTTTVNGHIDQLSKDLLQIILSFSKNALTFFGISRKFREVALSSLPKDKILTLKPGVTYFTVERNFESLDFLESHDFYGEPIPITQKRIDELRVKLLSEGPYTLEARKFEDRELGNTLYITSERLDQLCKRHQLDQPTVLAQLSEKAQKIHFNVGILKPQDNIRENVLYIAKSENGIHFAILQQFYNMTFRKGSSGEGLGLLSLFQGEITTSNLPLLACVHNKDFDVNLYKPYLDRMLAIVASRLNKEKCQHNLGMDPDLGYSRTCLSYSPTSLIFFNEQDAVQFASSLDFPAKQGQRYPLVHPCTVKHKVVQNKVSVPNGPLSSISGLTLLLKSDLTLLEGSYPVDQAGAKVPVVEPSAGCILM